MVDMTFEQSRHGCTGVEEHVGKVGTCTSRETSALSFAYRLSIQANVQSFEQGQGTLSSMRPHLR